MYRLIVAALALTCLAIPASAQEDGCTAQNPCEIAFTVDENGFDGRTDWNATVGDWYVLNVFNADFEGTTHTVTMDAYGISLEIPDIDERQSEPTQFTELGSFAVIDAPTGAEAVIHVIEYDVTVYEQGLPDGAQNDEDGLNPGGSGDPEPGDRDTPAISMMVAIGGLVALAAVRRTV